MPLHCFRELRWRVDYLCVLNFKKDKLRNKYGVRGIPSLIFVDGETGNVLNSDGRNGVVSDPNGINFPWDKVSSSPSSKCTVL